MTTEDKYWRFIAEQAAAIHEVATDEDLTPPMKKVRAEHPFYQMRTALRNLGFFL
jgi:hypothetical protein